jgi:thiamine kinase-like enzyme
MKNVTNDKLLNLLSELAIEKLELIPKWVQKNYPELVNENFEVLEGGQIALVVKIAEKYVIKLFLPKFGTNSNYEIGKQVTVNYCNLKSSKFDLSQFGIMLFCELDDILNVPILVLEYYKNTESLANILYKLDYDSRCQYVSKLVVELKKFNQPIANFDYDTQQILDTFDSELKKHSSKIDQQISDKFLEIRNKITPKIVKQDIFLIHNDIHLENILIDRLFMILIGENNIREIIAFPKNGQAMDLMTNSPSTIEPKALRELSIKLDL